MNEEDTQILQLERKEDINMVISKCFLHARLKVQMGLVEEKEEERKRIILTQRA